MISAAGLSGWEGRVGRGGHCTATGTHGVGARECGEGDTLGSWGIFIHGRLGTGTA